MSVYLLDGAFERVSRTGEHLADLKGQIETLRQAHENVCTADFDPDAPNLVRLSVPPVPIPPKFSILIGEVCYNLRAALDYLVFSLSCLDSGHPPKRTQFPIVDRKKDFVWRQEHGWLGDMNARHVAQIESLQPYKGCNWTKILKDLSNPDKHRHLTATAHEFVGTATVVAGSRDLLGEVSGPVCSTRRPDGVEMHMHFNLALNVQLTDGTPVIETLEILESQVSETLQAFKSEF